MVADLLDVDHVDAADRRGPGEADARPQRARIIAEGGDDAALLRADPVDAGEQQPEQRRRRSGRRASRAGRRAGSRRRSGRGSSSGTRRARLGPPSGRGRRLAARRWPQGLRGPPPPPPPPPSSAAGAPGPAAIVAQHGAEAPAPPENSSHDALIGTASAEKQCQAAMLCLSRGAMSDETSAWKRRWRAMRAALAGPRGDDPAQGRHRHA